VAFVQKVGATVNGSGAVITPSLTGVVAGHTLALAISGGALTDSVPTDSSGQTWTKSYFTTSGPSNIAVYYLLSANAGTHTVTWTEGSNVNAGATYSLVEMPACSAVDVLGTASTVVATTSTTTTANITTVNASDILLGVVTVDCNTGSANQGITDPPTGWTSLQVQQNTSANYGAEICYQEVATAGAKSATWTYASDTITYIGQIVSFKIATTGTFPLTATQSAPVVGIVKPGASGPLVANAGTGTTGTAKAATVATLSQVAGIGALGTVKNAASIALTSVAGVGAVGTVTVLSSGVTAALSQVAGSGAVGTAIASVNKALTQNSGSGAVGTPVALAVSQLSQVASVGAAGIAGSSASAALAGVVAVGSIGSIAAGVSISLNGVSGTGTVGSVAAVIPGGGALTQAFATGTTGSATPVVVASLSQGSGSGAVGTAGVNASIVVSGVSGVGSIGSVSAQIGAQLSGASGIGATGSVSIPAVILLGNVSSAGVIGSTSAGVVVALSGSVATGSVGTVSPSCAAFLARVSGTGSVGSVTATNTGPVTVGLSGVQSSGIAGLIGTIGQNPNGAGFPYKASPFQWKPDNTRTKKKKEEPKVEIAVVKHPGLPRPYGIREAIAHAKTPRYEDIAKGSSVRLSSLVGDDEDELLLLL
jgi:hypothetical protein